MFRYETYLVVMKQPRISSTKLLRTVTTKLTCSSFQPIVLDEYGSNILIVLDCDKMLNFEFIVPILGKHFIFDPK